MGNPPSRLLRWGTGVMFSVFVLFILFAWLIRYPDTIPAPVEITTSNPPVTLITKITGNIKHIYVIEKEKVSAGQLLAVMETTASIEEINSLKQIVDTIRKPEFLTSKILPEFSELGEMQETYGTFRRDLSDLKNYLENDFNGFKIASLTGEIREIQEYINRLIVKEKLYTENQKLEAKNLKETHCSSWIG